MKTPSVSAFQQSVCWELHKLVNCFPPVLFTTTLFQISLVLLCELSCCQINQRYVMGTKICYSSPNPKCFRNCRLKKKINSFLCQNTPSSVPHTVKISKSNAFHHATVWECFSLHPYHVDISQKYLVFAVPGGSSSRILSSPVGFLWSWLWDFRQQKAAGAALQWQQCCSQTVSHALLQALQELGEL